MKEQLSQKQSQLNRISEEALHTAKDRIVANMRFLDSAVFALKDHLQEDGKLLFCTDGTMLYYSSDYVIHCCRDGLSELVHNYMHVLLHCIFHHQVIGMKVDSKCWNIASDIAVEALIQSFDSAVFRSSLQLEREKLVNEMRVSAGGISAERIYRYLMGANLPSAELERFESVFHVDDHSIWYDTSPKWQFSEDDSEQSRDDGEDSDDSEVQKIETPDWDRIAQMVKISLEAEEMGLEEGDFLSALNARTHKHVDYSSFLRKFAVHQENLKVDDSEFDYIYYTYGLELYGDMPLVEPLEYSDEKSIRDLVIVIDTSASTGGELVERFIQRTFDMLTGSTEIQNRFNIHLIQCDAVIQDDQILRSQDDIQRFMEHFELKGLGGTDYRPAFQYVNEMVERGEFSRLQGLLYFTDGKGVFPKRKPPYDTAFIFEDEESAEATELPSWAMKVVFGRSDEYRTS